MPQHQEPRRVLYVEDDDDIREIARLALEVVGEFEVMLCASGKTPSPEPRPSTPISYCWM
ncbi:hypothetical protein MBH78_07295 [Oceanimonas sp. NS1]|nr:hypothetical protein [Oceanimonas sp. NS1]